MASWLPLVTIGIQIETLKNNLCHSSITLKQAATKIDKALKEEVERFISEGENRLRYPTLKQFVDVAVLEALRKKQKEAEEPK